MKAKELAELLLQNPEMEVYHEDYIWDDYDGFNTINKVNSIVTTPSGIFIVSSGIGNYEEESQIKSPSRKPVLDTIRIKLKDDVRDEDFPYFCIGQERDMNLECFFELYSDLGNAYTSYIECTGSHWILYDENNRPEDDEYISRQIEESGSYSYRIEDVDYIEVLESIDDNWNCTYKKYTFQEALKYATEKYNLQDKKDMSVLYQLASDIEEDEEYFFVIDKDLGDICIDVFDYESEEMVLSNRFNEIQEAWDFINIYKKEV